MIEPLVSEPEWLAVLNRGRVWVPPPKPTLVISPHPDDETLGAGGLIAWQTKSGVPVTVAAVTDGEAAYVNSPGLGETRRVEQELAVKALGFGISIVRLGIPDSAVSLHEAELEAQLRPLISGETLVIAPWIQDWHPDHEACARVAGKLCRESGAELVSYVFWTWHRRTRYVFDGVGIRRLELSPELVAAKRAALECHVSQLEGEGPILPPLLLAPAFRSFESYV
jgi:LmbE family N-acetylglucosaminyl deacetylase